MLNPFVLKKYAALLIAGIFSAIGYRVGLQFYGLWGGIGFMFGGLLISTLVGLQLLKHPFTVMLEGGGILVLNIDSTGIIRPFNVTVDSPFIRGFFEKGKPVTDAFDRDATFHLAAPLKKGSAVPNEEGGLDIKLTEAEMNKGRFALFHYPLFIYNAQIGSIVTKDFLSNKEKDSFAEHGVLYLNRKMEELTSTLRDFARYIVEQLKPGKNIFQSKWVIYIIIAALIILGIIFAPAIIDMFKGIAGNVGDAAGGAGGVITHR